jgi:hypothetical protein
MILRRDSRLFIEDNNLSESDCVADFNPYYTGMIEEKMTCAGSCLHLQTNDHGYLDWLNIINRNVSTKKSAGA